MTRTLRTTTIALGLALVVGVAGVSWSGTTPTPPDNYKKVSSLVPLPEFIPGLGTLYVDPSTLPVGPFLSYDRSGKLMGSVYMVPMKDFEAKKSLSDLGIAKEKVDHVDMYYNAGHPGVPEPHYHIAVWYVSPDQVAQLKK